MPLDGQRKIARVHAVAIVGDADERDTAACRHHVDITRTGIDGVFDQFLNYARRTLDHFAGRDAVYGLRR